MGYNIAMVTDFFYPQPGGVEFHVYHLSQKLIDRGHSIIIITHQYGHRSGIRYLTNGLKVYYLPIETVYRSASLPGIFISFPVLRNVFIREQIEIVHGHATWSALAHEAFVHARTMGLRTVFTEHSLFGFADLGSIWGNKILKFTLVDAGHVICVSHTCRENTVLRSGVESAKVSVIPNAVVSRDFKPRKGDENASGTKKEEREEQDGGGGDDDVVTIVVITRLFPNKGADLLNAIIPKICMADSRVRFVIAGDGPKFLDLEQTREKYFLQERVELLGAVRHEEVRDVMVLGDIYLHPSLTEAFGTVLVEAVSCGLYVVTTKVGGIPEVLPGNMTSFAEPEETSLVETTLEVIQKIRSGEIDTTHFHDSVGKMYSWGDIARRTEVVYDSLDLDEVNESLVDRLATSICLM
ncbi:uncharacterized protein LODBEIA_P15560 [Lodderomyces beijingensis]|uniref:phosphatidylinositol N-acetylglucosaminyltransferase n=1 Tax=Lodderomyces beijingensis TaxID=1775926 RepID=A0ABP0ZGP3_9ASCO